MNLNHTVPITLFDVGVSKTKIRMRLNIIGTVVEGMEDVRYPKVTYFASEGVYLILSFLGVQRIIYED